jgi:hypothetical protein
MSWPPFAPGETLHPEETTSWTQKENAMKKLRRISPIIAIAFVALAASFAGLPFATASVDHAPQQGATMSIPF